jgi:2-isopropylmalate synthase
MAEACRMKSAARCCACAERSRRLSASIATTTQSAILVQGTVNGIGERCGNANLLSILAILQAKMGVKSIPAKKMQEMTALSHYVSEICNMPLHVNQPFTGRGAFAHKGGVHINAMMKNAKTYEHMNPELIGNHRRYLVSELGGKTNIMLKAKELNIDLQKESPETRNILTEIQKLENDGYQFEAAEASFELLMQRLMGREKKFFKTKKVEISAEKIGEDNPTVEAYVTVEVKNQEETKTASGNGPVDALYQALRNALIRFYPQIEQIHLTDYKVRVVNSEGGTGAKVRVTIEFQDEKKTWATIGVNENIIEASWKALVEAIEYKLLKG